MLILSFEGWWQNRMSTDPDPRDEPRGVSGHTFWAPGEPYLDSIIRLQNPKALRYPHQNDFGVTVRRVALTDPAAPGNQLIQTEHPLLGATVDWLNNPQFDERNFVVLYQKMPINPFHLRMEGNGIVIEREDLYDITRPDLSYEDVCAKFPELLIRRSIRVQPQSPVVAEATGVMDYAKYRQQRKINLEQILQATTDETEKAALKKRIRNLEKDNEGMVGATLPSQQFLGLCGFYEFDINGPLQISDPSNSLGGEIGASQVWPISFWMGGYDCDSLCGYLRGTLSLPFYPDRPACAI